MTRVVPWLSVALLAINALGCGESALRDRGNTDLQSPDLGLAGGDGVADAGEVADSSDPANKDALATDVRDLRDRGFPVDAAVTHDAATQPDSRPAPAGEVLLFDRDNLQFTYEDSGFMRLVSPGDALPMGDWSSPIDYYEGQFQVRYVVNGPSNQAAGRLQTCIWTMAKNEGGRNYFPESCSGHPQHDGPGVYYNDRLVPSKWWKMDGVSLDFSRPDLFLIRVVLRGASGCNVTRHNVSNGCWDEWSKYENMKFRVTIVMVGPVESFSGWDNYP